MIYPGALIVFTINNEYYIGPQLADGSREVYRDGEFFCKGNILGCGTVKGDKTYSLDHQDQVLPEYSLIMTVANDPKPQVWCSTLMVQIAPL